MNLPSLDEQIVLVTGGAGGLGEATCRVLSEDGATVVVADIRSDRARSVAEDIQRNGAKAEPLALDVCDEHQIEKALNDIVARYGRLDVLVNNAAIDKTVPVEELTGAEWDRIIGINLSGPFLLSKHALPQMKKQGHGHIVNIVSTAAKRAWPNAAAYHASKWGLLGLSHALHAEARPHGVKVTALVAGGMRTPFLLDRFADIDQGTLQDPRNVAETIRYVLSQPAETVIPEVMVIPMRETSWP
jgi:NAD(P)-dependent dehydrogenase (short-subunit alcohol dehydrogenase family)